MTKNKRMSYHYPLLLFMSMTALSITRLQRFMIEGIGRNVLWFWIPITLLVILLTWLSIYLHKQIDQRSLLECFHHKGLGWMRSALYIAYAALFMGLTFYICMNTGDFVARVLVQSDSKTMVLIEIILTCLVALFPIESMVRYAHLASVTILPIFFLLGLLQLRNMHWAWVYPNIYPEEWISPWDAIMSLFVIFAPAAAFTFKSLETKKPYLSSFMTIGFVGFYTASMIALGIGTFGIHIAQEAFYLSYLSVSAVRIENFFFERIIYLGIITWKYIEFIAAGFFLRCAGWCISRAFHISLSPWTMVFLALSMQLLIISTDYKYILKTISMWLGFVSMILIVCVPMLAFGIYKWKGKPL